VIHQKVQLILLKMFIFIEYYYIIYLNIFRGVIQVKLFKVKAARLPLYSRGTWTKKTFWEGNMLQFEVNVGEWGKHIRHANTNIARRNYNMILSKSWLCYSKWKARDGLSAVEDSRVTRCVSARSEVFDLLVRGFFIFSCEKYKWSLLLGHKNKNIL
jgi:hypothetical protein